MRTVKDIYTTYRILPALQAHQLRVASVALFIAEHMKQSIDKESVTLACLFPDLGNIIKADLTYFPKFLEPQGLAYWEQVKSDFIQKYGTSEHGATAEIVSEIGVPITVRSLISGLGFSNMEEVERESEIEMKLCE